MTNDTAAPAPPGAGERGPRGDALVAGGVGTVGAGAAAAPESGPGEADALSIGRRIRHYRTERGLTLAQLGAAVDRAASQISAFENGRREPSVSLLRACAKELGVTVADLLDPRPVDARQALELEAERNQESALYSSLGLPHVRVKSQPTETLEAIVGLQRALGRVLEQRAATPEEARRANRMLREQMRAKDNHFPDIEAAAAGLLATVGYDSGPLTQRQAAGVAEHLGFTLHYVPDLPRSTRSVLDEKNNRIYLSNDTSAGQDARSQLLTTLASHILEHTTPKNFQDFLLQRVEANYLAAALLVPEKSAVAMLQTAKKNRQISIEGLRDQYGVSYETAAHRFTNLATAHLDLPVHFMKVHNSGTIYKAYSNDGLPFPTDPLGSVEGQYGCKRFTSRTVFTTEDRFSPYFQYTDTPAGTFWCTARVLPGGGDFSISVGVPFQHVKWFWGQDTPHRSESRCPDPTCCRQPPAELAAKWEHASWPSARTHASLLAAVPPGVFPGVDTTEVYQFLERHEPHPPL
ncbi:helix-turn-helix domain-containing protein [Brevibacterium sp. 5221]|uniref:Helix-turn-helix domain-containing protein n=1 Tax=Brevibacterium rongguiense TaxID=2695267 RepID=A0A6N9H8B0_9MICO|nr:helix-turn-helix domain-containing protein [Brevibacterium rongguiense]MYM20145.1 helix-turn-helix domain-containing protein [Brevibacterium rongguiense]